MAAKELDLRDVSQTTVHMLGQSQITCLACSMLLYIRALIAWYRLTDVFIKPEHRRKGLAKWLVSWILESSEVKVCGKIELMALENEARLYRECGFEEWKDGRLTFMHRTVKN